MLMVEIYSTYDKKSPFDHMDLLFSKQAEFVIFLKTGCLTAFLPAFCLIILFMALILN